MLNDYTAYNCKKKPVSEIEDDTFTYIRGRNLDNFHFNDLNLSNTNIQYTLKNNSNIFRLAKIKHLHMRGNNLTYIPKGVFSKVKDFFDSLHTVDFSHNRIESLRADLFEGFEKCRHLYLDYNHISFIDFETFYNMWIVTLSLSHNKLKGIFRDNSYLKRLDLSHNEISCITNDGFDASLSKLIYLNLKYNKLTELDSSIFKNNPVLQNLYLNGNNIAVLHMITFYELPELEILDLRDNNISYLDPRTFMYNRKLNTLLLNGNNVTECIWLENSPEGLETLNFTNTADIDSEVCFKKLNCSSFGQKPNVQVFEFKHHSCEFCQCQCPSQNCTEKCGGSGYQILINKYGCVECKCSCVLPDCEVQCDENSGACVKGMFF